MKTLNVKGVMVVSDDWGIGDEYVTDCAALCREIDATDDDLTIAINSYGGDVEGGTNLSITLANWKAAHPDKALAVEIGAICASAAANLLARMPQGANVRIHPESMVMYHSCGGMVWGSPDQLRDAAAQMDKVNEVVIRSLLSKTTLDAATVRAWFAAGREGWLSGLDAVECGLADELADGFMEAAPELPEEGMEENGRLAAVAAIKAKLINKETTAMAEETETIEKTEEVTITKPAEEETEKKVETEVETKTPQGECGDPNEKAELDALKTENESLRAEIETLKATCEKLTKGLNAPSANAQPRKNFAELVREIPRDLPEREYMRRFTALKTTHKLEFDAYMAEHSKR